MVLLYGAKLLKQTWRNYKSCKTCSAFNTLCFIQISCNPTSLGLNLTKRNTFRRHFCQATKGVFRYFFYFLIGQCSVSRSMKHPDLTKISARNNRFNSTLDHVLLISHNSFRPYTITSLILQSLPFSN